MKKLFKGFLKILRKIFYGTLLDVMYFHKLTLVLCALLIGFIIDDSYPLWLIHLCTITAIISILSFISEYKGWRKNYVMREIQKISCSFDREIESTGDRDWINVHVHFPDGSVKDKLLYINKCMHINKISDDYQLSRIIVLFYKVHYGK